MSLISKIAGSNEVRAGSATFIWYALALAVISAVYVFLLTLARRKKMEQSANAAWLVELKTQVEEDQKLAKNEETRKAAEAEIVQLSAEIEEHRQNVAKADQDCDEILKKLTAVNSWSDLVVKPVR